MNILPLSWRRWLWYKNLDAYTDRIGFWFCFKGDEVCWTWPWRRKGKPKYISLMFSGAGEFGDARFATLKELDAEWEGFYAALSDTENNNKEHLL